MITRKKKTLDPLCEKKREEKKSRPQLPAAVFPRPARPRALCVPTGGNAPRKRAATFSCASSSSFTAGPSRPDSRLELLNARRQFFAGPVPPRHLGGHLPREPVLPHKVIDGSDVHARRLRGRSPLRGPEDGRVEDLGFLMIRDDLGDVFEPLQCASSSRAVNGCGPEGRTREAAELARSGQGGDEFLERSPESLSPPSAAGSLRRRNDGIDHDDDGNDASPSPPPRLESVASPARNSVGWCIRSARAAAWRSIVLVERKRKSRLPFFD